MIIQKGKVYEDRQGHSWLILSLDGNKIAPVTAGRWEGKNYRTRVFKRDGSYWGFKDDPWDLIKEVT